MASRARRIWIPLAWIVIPAALGACGVPPPLTIATSGLDGVAYATEGKSTSDMAISGVAGRNCALWRVVKEEPICKDYTLEEKSQLALNRQEIARGHPNVILMSDVESSYFYPGASVNPSKSPSATVLAEADMPKSDTKFGAPTVPPAVPVAAVTAQKLDGGTEPHVAPVQVKATPLGTKVAESRATAAKAAHVRRDGVYLVLASFSTHANAERARGLYVQAQPSFAVAVVDSPSYHRVVGGPFAPRELGPARMRIEKTFGIYDAWTLPACTSTNAAGCVVLARPGVNKTQLAALN